jgi:hypothetical protein
VTAALEVALARRRRYSLDTVLAFERDVVGIASLLTVVCAARTGIAEAIYELQFETDRARAGATPEARVLCVAAIV